MTNAIIEDGKGPCTELVPHLTPTQEHFFKKYLLEKQLKHELHYLSQPKCLEHIGSPFKTGSEDSQENPLPLVKFFFHNFIETFPFIVNNDRKEQLSFWQDTVQPFVESFNEKNISDSLERKEEITKRGQANSKLTHGLTLFYNSMLITENDLTYLTEDHIRPSQAGKLEKLQKGAASNFEDLPNLEDLKLYNANYSALQYHNDVYVNIVAVRRVDSVGTLSPQSSRASFASSSRELSMWNPFRFMSLSAATPKHHYEFILQVTQRTKVDIEKGYTYSSHYIGRPYHQFKRLENSLKKKFPGLMAASVPSVPLKLDHDIGFPRDSENPDDTKLYREKLRSALRGYLHTLIKHSEIVHSDIFDDFINDKFLSYKILSPVEEEDYKERLQYEKSIIANQFEFQQQTIKVVHDLAQDFEKFKLKLIKSPDTLMEIFDELSHAESVSELSPLLRTFVEWSKLEVAATLYLVFLGQDNSSQWLLKCQKFHRLFPYNIIYGILKFTNPVKIVSRVIDLLLVNLPSISLTSWFPRGGESNDALKQESKKTGANNLLSMIFVMLLNEDLNDFEKELKRLKESAIFQLGNYDECIKKIENYVLASDGETVDEIKYTAVLKDEDLLLTVLKSEILEPAQLTHPERLKDIEEAYRLYNSLGEHKDLEEADLYLTLKQYWQILIRKKDKDIMKQLWKERELTQLIKKFLTIFYQPLMKIFKKCDIHLVFKDFEQFMDDLITELNKLNQGQVFSMSSIEIFNRFKQILDRHENVFWRFLHDMYVNDDTHIFLTLFQWVEKFLKIIRKKYVDENQVKVLLYGMTASVPLNPEKFTTQLNDRITHTLKKRMLLKQYLQEGSSQDTEGNIGSLQDRIDKKWEEVNDDIFGNSNGREFGIDTDDINDFNIMHKHQDYVSLRGNVDKNKPEQDEESEEKKLVYKKIAEIDNALSMLDTSELDKFAPSFKTSITDLLDQFQLD